MNIASIADTQTGLFGHSSATNAATTDARFQALLADADDSKKSLHDLTGQGASGLLKWKIDEMKKDITKDVMGSMNVTPEQLAAMPATQRIATENQIMREVSQRLQTAMAEDMKQKQTASHGGAGTMQSILSAQEVGTL